MPKRRTTRTLPDTGGPWGVVRDQGGVVLGRDMSKRRAERLAAELAKGAGDGQTYSVKRVRRTIRLE